MADLIVVTGGACSGKTSVVAELVARGYEALPEAAYEVIDELNRALGIDEQIRWREANQVEFQRRVSERQHAREERARRDVPSLVFCDRGLLDGIAYCQLAGVAWPADLQTLAATALYTHVFVLETLSPFDSRRATGRIDSQEEAIRVTTMLAEVYRPRALALTHVPDRSTAERTDLMLRTLGL